MRIRSLLPAAALSAAVVLGGLAATAPAAWAASVEGKISAIGADSNTVTINKKSYRVSEGAKVLVSGKPGSFESLKVGMQCKAQLGHKEATSLNCTGKGK